MKPRNSVGSWTMIEQYECCLGKEHDSMLLDAESKDRTRVFSLHIELIMWGDDFLDIDADNPAEPVVKWLSLCDGGSIENEGCKSITKETFDRMCFINDF